MARRVGRGIALLFHDRGTRRGWVVSSTPRPHFTHGKDPVPILQEAGWAPGPVWMGGKSRPHRDSILDRPARSQSLHRHLFSCMYVKPKMIRNVEEDDHYYGANSGVVLGRRNLSWLKKTPTPCLCLSLDTSPFLSATLRSATADLNLVGDVGQLLDLKLSDVRDIGGGVSARGVATVGRMVRPSRAAESRGRQNKYCEWKQEVRFPALKILNYWDK